MSTKHTPPPTYRPLYPQQPGPSHPGTPRPRPEPSRTPPPPDTRPGKH